MIVALLGAECTGKSSLTRLLGERLAAPTVSEYLREWCLREGRTPRRDEQATIAAEQQRRIADAAGAPLLIADTTALMTAVYSAHYFGDASLLPTALAAHRQAVSVTLLCSPTGIPWQGDGCLRDGAAVRQAVHERLLMLLREQALPHHLLQGPLPQRLEQALHVVADAGRHNPTPC